MSWLGIIWAFLAAWTVFLIIWRTVEYGFFYGKDYLLWIVLPVTIYMAIKRINRNTADN